VRFTATVSPQTASGTPTGSVTFFNGTTSLGSFGLDGTGTASVDVAAGAAGTALDVTANYAGDANFSAAQSGSVIEGVLSTGAVYTPNTNGFILDGWGGLHPWSHGNALKPPRPRTAPYWPGWNIARGIAANQPAMSCVVEVDGWGGIHQLDWPVSPATVVGAPYWPTWDIARDVILMPDCSGGYVLDGWGAMHPFGLGHAPPPPITTGPYWRGWDVARGAVMLVDGTGGYIFDAWGGAHAFALPNNPLPAAIGKTLYTPGIDHVRGATLDNRFGVLTVSSSGGTAGGGINGTVPPSNPLGTTLSIPIVEGIMTFGV
jgi:hypothetical protein